MAKVTRKIGLSLGADLCWPAAYEELVRRLDLTVPVGGDEVSFQVERVLVEPFSLRYTPSYDLVIDRLTHWFPITREWIKKLSFDGVYTLNNPWAIQSMEKHTSYVAMMKLGLPIPETWMVPAKEYDLNDGQWDWDVTVRRYNKLFDLGDVGEKVGYPAFIKPYDGGGWVGVQRVTDPASLRAAYDKSGKRVHHLQAAVPDWDLFIRCIGIGPQVNIVRYDPDKPLHDRYRVDFNFLDADGYQRATRITRTINAFFGWDFNSCELLRNAEDLHPIDFANACPDSQVTSLHYHFPWLVTAMVRWTLFNAAVQRKIAQKLHHAHVPLRGSFSHRCVVETTGIHPTLQGKVAQELHDAHVAMRCCAAHREAFDDRKVHTARPWKPTQELHHLEMPTNHGSAHRFVVAVRHVDSTFHRKVCQEL